MREKEQIKYWAVVEYTPAHPKGDWRRIVVVRDNREDAQRILKVLEETDINFEVYAIEGLGEEK